MIEFKNVFKEYEQNNIIKNFNLKINEGELVVLIGASGSGKTTLLKMINRLISISKGEIWVGDQEISKINPVELRRNIGYVIQQVGLFPHLSIKENIELIPRLVGIKSIPEVEKKTEELLKMVGLNPVDYQDRYPVELSGGQQQRIGVARAFATEAEVILMDEPFSALDPITRSELQEELFTIQKEQNKTIVFVTHDMDEAINLADRICILQNGEIVQYDTPENIIKNPATPYVETFVGKGKIWSKPELITATDLAINKPVTISPKRTILQAIQIMTEKKIDSLPVVSKEKKLLGRITLNQLQLASVEEKIVQDIMEKKFTTIAENDPLASVLEKFDGSSHGSVPVINEKNELRGLITKSSLLSVLSLQFTEEGSDH